VALSKLGTVIRGDSPQDACTREEPFRSQDTQEIGTADHKGAAGLPRGEINRSEDSWGGGDVGPPRTVKEKDGKTSKDPCITAFPQGGRGGTKTITGLRWRFLRIWSKGGNGGGGSPVLP